MRREKLRTVRFQPYRSGFGPHFVLTIFDTHRVDARGCTVLAYQLCQLGDDARGEGGSRVVFTGADFACSPLRSVDGDDTVESVMTFLTLQPGDTDGDYFADYTADQLEFARHHGAALSCAVADLLDRD